MNKIYLVSLILFTTGCSSLGSMFNTVAVPTVKPIEVITIEKPAPMYHPPLPGNIDPAEVKWKILNPETMREYVNNYDNGE